MNPILRLWRYLNLVTLLNADLFGFILQNTHQNAKKGIITTRNNKYFS
jgi:hypothetical protein